jgi:hypothetical protein
MKAAASRSAVPAALIDPISGVSLARWAWSAKLKFVALSNTGALATR